MAENENFTVSLEDLRNAVGHNARANPGLSSREVGALKAPVTSAWNKLMSHRYGTIGEHADLCQCGLEPIAQEVSTAKRVDVEELDEAVGYLATDRKVNFTDTHAEVLRGAVERLFEVLPAIAEEIRQAELDTVS